MQNAHAFNAKKFSCELKPQSGMHISLQMTTPEFSSSTDRLLRKKYLQMLIVHTYHVKINNYVKTVKA